MLLSSVVIVISTIVGAALLTSYVIRSGSCTLLIKAVDFFIQTTSVVAIVSVSSAVITVISVSAWTITAKSVTITAIISFSVWTVATVISVPAWTIATIVTFSVWTVITVVSVVWTVVVLLTWLIGSLCLCRTCLLKLIHIICCTLADWTHRTLAYRARTDDAMLLRSGSVIISVSSRSTVVATIISVATLSRSSGLLAILRIKDSRDA